MDCLTFDGPWFQFQSKLAEVLTEHAEILCLEMGISIRQVEIMNSSPCKSEKFVELLFEMSYPVMDLKYALFACGLLFAFPELDKMEESVKRGTLRKVKEVISKETHFTLEWRDHLRELSEIVAVAPIRICKLAKIKRFQYIHKMNQRKSGTRSFSISLVLLETGFSVQKFRSILLTLDLQECIKDFDVLFQLVVSEE